MSSSEHLLQSKYELSETQYENISHYLLDSLLINKQKHLIVSKLLPFLLFLNTINLSMNYFVNISVSHEWLKFEVVGSQS